MKQLTGRRHRLADDTEELTLPSVGNYTCDRNNIMAQIAYYRFEGPHDILGNVVDASGRSGFHGAILMGAPTFNRNVSMTSVPRTASPNRSSMRFGARDVVRFAYPFPFQTHAQATLELWLNP